MLLESPNTWASHGILRVSRWSRNREAEESQGLGGDPRCAAAPAEGDAGTGLVRTQPGPEATRFTTERRKTLPAHLPGPGARQQPGKPAGARSTAKQQPRAGQSAAWLPASLYHLRFPKSRKKPKAITRLPEVWGRSFSPYKSVYSDLHQSTTQPLSCLALPPPSLIFSAECACPRQAAWNEKQSPMCHDGGF